MRRQGIQDDYDAQIISLQNLRSSFSFCRFESWKWGAHLMRAVLNGSFHIMLHANGTLLCFSCAHVEAAPHLHKQQNSMRSFWPQASWASSKFTDFSPHSSQMACDVICSSSSSSTRGSQAIMPRLIACKTAGPGRVALFACLLRRHAM